VDCGELQMIPRKQDSFSPSILSHLIAQLLINDEDDNDGGTSRNDKINNQLVLLLLLLREMTTDNEVQFSYTRGHKSLKKEAKLFPRNDQTREKRN
jgi:uncharacterized protein YyaL (SSP411 family)